MDFGKVIREARKKVGLTQSELAKASNMSLNSISRYESGKRSPDFGALQKIANALHVSVDLFIGSATNLEFEAEYNNLPKVKEIHECTGLSMDACDFIHSAHHNPFVTLALSDILENETLMMLLCQYINTQPQDGAFIVGENGTLVVSKPGKDKDKGLGRIYAPDMILKAMQEKIIAELEKMRLHNVGENPGRKLEKGEPKKAGGSNAKTPGE